MNGKICVNWVTPDTQIVNPFALSCLADWIDKNFELKVGDFNSATVIFTRAFYTLEVLSLGIFFYYYRTIYTYKVLPCELFKKILFIFREGERKERERERYQCVVASYIPSTGDLACNPGMCSDWGSKWQPFGLQACAQSTELHQPGPL